MRNILMPTLSLLFVACTPSGELDVAAVNASSGKTRIVKANEVKIAGGSTAATGKRCDPKRDPNCINADKITATGGSNDIIPDPMRPASAVPLPTLVTDIFGVPSPRNPRGTGNPVYMTIDTGSRSSMAIDTHLSMLARATSMGDSSVAEAWIGPTPRGQRVTGVLMLDLDSSNARAHDLSMVVVLSDDSTWLVEGGAPTGAIQFEY